MRGWFSMDAVRCLSLGLSLEDGLPPGQPMFATLAEPVVQGNDDLDQLIAILEISCCAPISSALFNNRKEVVECLIVTRR
ncbi:hypothetical protein ABIC35_000726 [Sphingomonas trueperi]